MLSRTHVGPGKIFKQEHEKILILLFLRLARHWSDFIERVGVAHQEWLLADPSHVALAGQEPLSGDLKLNILAQIVKFKQSF